MPPQSPERRQAGRRHDDLGTPGPGTVFRRPATAIEDTLGFPAHGIHSTGQLRRIFNRFAHIAHFRAKGPNPHLAGLFRHIPDHHPAGQGAGQVTGIIGHQLGLTRGVKRHEIVAEFLGRGLGLLPPQIFAGQIRIARIGQPCPVFGDIDRRRLLAHHQQNHRPPGLIGRNRQLPQHCFRVERLRAWTLCAKRRRPDGPVM